MKKSISQISKSNEWRSSNIFILQRHVWKKKPCDNKNDSLENQKNHNHVYGQNG